MTLCVCVCVRARLLNTQLPQDIRILVDIRPPEMPIHFMPFLPGVRCF